MIKKRWYLAAIGLPLLFAGCGGEEDMNAKMAGAAIQAKQGKLDEAGKNAGKVAAARPKESAPKLLQSLSYERSGEYDKALDLARQSVELAPKDFTAMYTLGRLTAKDRMRRSEAFSILERALELKPRDRNTLVLLCNLGTELGHPQVIRYLHQLRMTKEFAQSPVLYYQFGRYFVRVKNKREACVWLRGAAMNGFNTKNWNLVLDSARCIDQAGFSPKDAHNWYVMYRNWSGNRGAEYREVNERIAQLDKQLKQNKRPTKTVRKGKSR